MNPRQHDILMHLQRLFSALLPGGPWYADRFQVEPCPAGRVANSATQNQTLCDRVIERGFRKA